jgi:hypothetical protein
VLLLSLTKEMMRLWQMGTLNRSRG